MTHFYGVAGNLAVDLYLKNDKKLTYSTIV